MSLKRMVALGALVLSLAFTSGLAVAADKAAPAGKVNVNTASVEQLSELPGIGPSLAARIVEMRTKQGPFRTAEELLKVRGIGEKSFAKLQPRVTVDDTPSAKSGGNR